MLGDMYRLDLRIPGPARWVNLTDSAHGSVPTSRCLFGMASASHGYSVDNAVRIFVFGGLDSRGKPVLESRTDLIFDKFFRHNIGISMKSCILLIIALHR
jgi:hypothetical protein